MYYNFPVVVFTHTDFNRRTRKSRKEQWSRKTERIWRV